MLFYKPSQQLCLSNSKATNRDFTLQCLRLKSIHSNRLASTARKAAEHQDPIETTVLATLIARDGKQKDVAVLLKGIHSTF